MELAVLNTKKESVGKQKLPSQFSELVREDLVKKAVLTIQSRKRQPYGAKPGAGMRASAKISRRRRDYKGAYGHGISRVPRKIMTKRGSHFFWVAAVAPGTVGGRRAHPPKAGKVWAKDMNKKERRKAIRSALAATLDSNLVASRGHIVPEKYPFVLEDSVESLAKTQDAQEALLALGFEGDLSRSMVKKVRAGKGKMRGRRYNKKKGPLLVVSGKCPLMGAAANLPGVDIVIVDDLNTELLAPGTVVGRLTVFTQAAIKRLEDKKLFM